METEGRRKKKKIERFLSILIFSLFVFNRRCKEGIKVRVVNIGTEMMTTQRVGMGNSWEEKRVGPKLLELAMQDQSK